MTDIVFSLNARGQTAFAARESGLVRSLDSGKSWHPVFATPGAEGAIPATTVTLSPQFENDKTVFATVPGAILRSKDSGETWEMTRLPTPAPYITALAIPIIYTQNRALFAASLEDGVFRSTDNGATWNSWNFGLLDYQAFSLAISPTNTLYVGTNTGLFSSRNVGRLWSEIVLPCGNVPILCLACSSRLILAGTEGAGLFASPDEGKTWRRLGDDSLETVNALLTDGETILALTGDSLYLSQDCGVKWVSMPGILEGTPSAMAAFGSLDAGETILVGYESGELSLLTI